MAKDAGLTTPQHTPTHMDYEKECKTVLSPFVTDILDRAETAGWDRRQAAAAVMYIAAMEIKLKS